MKSDREGQLDRELRFHIEEQVRANVASGMSEAEARRRAQIEFGGLEQIKEECRDARSTAMRDEMGRDLRYALRSFRRAPGFAAAVILTLGLGVGANTAVFTVIHRTVLATLPVRDPEQLRTLLRTDGGGEAATFSREFHRRVQKETAQLDGVLLRGGRERVTVGTTQGGDAAVGELVSGNYFDVLGVAPFAGRLLTSSDDLTDGAHPVVVLSHSYWVSRFGSDLGLIGRTIQITGHPMTVIGITPPGFEGLDPGVIVDLRFPVSMLAEVRGLPANAPRRDSPEFNVIARVRPGAAEAFVQDRLTEMFRRERLDAAPQTTATRPENVELRSAASGFGRTRQQLSTPLWSIFVMTIVVLLVACMNLANLFLARSASRRHEFAVRMSLGAGRGRLARQLLAEVALLSAAGAVVGAFCAYAGAAALSRFIADNGPAGAVSAEPNLTVLAFHGLISVACGLIVGLGPALGVGRLDLVARLKGTTENSNLRLTGRKVLVGAQVALSTIVLVGAFMFARSLEGLRSMPLGFRPDHILIAALSPRNAGLPDSETRSFFHAVRERVSALPGVDAVSFSMVRLVSGSGWNADVVVEGDESGRRAARNAVGPTYFATLGIPLIGGREFSDSDDSGAPKVAIVNQAFVRLYFHGQDPIGRRIGASTPDVTIVGVVGDARYDRLRTEIPPQWYVPYEQFPGAKYLDLNIRTKAAPETLIASVRSAIAAVDRRVALFEVRTQERQIDEALLTERVLASLATLFGVLAAGLAGLGLQAVLSLLVATKRREIGIRLALGARPSGAAREIAFEAARWFAPGLLTGCVLAVSLATLVRSVLYGVGAVDLVSLVGAASLLTVLSLLAVAVPVRRAASTDPLLVIREP